MRSSFTRILTCATTVLFVASCGQQEMSIEATAEAVQQPSNRVDIPASVRRNLGITFVTVERRRVANTMRLPGSFELMPQARREHRQLLAGVIQFEVKQFESVESGQLLYRYRSNEWLRMQAQIDLSVATVEQAKAKLEAVEKRIAALASADFKRADLDAETAVLRAELALQKVTLGSALNQAAIVLGTQAGLAGPEALLIKVNKIPRYQSIDWIEVRSEASGVVESLEVTDGSFVDAASLVLTLVDPTMVRFRASGLQSDIPKYTNGQQVHIVPPQASNSVLNEAIVGQLAIAATANPVTRTVALYAIPSETRAWARPGVTAFLEIVTEDSAGVVLAIPKAAIVKDGIVHVFFKRDPIDPNKAVRVEADLGIDDGRWVEVSSGIGPNDTVVLEGVYELKLATAQGGTSQKGGHFHADGTFHAEDH